jgi:alpha-beta hydrolase superfamily lysophospholipase
VSPRTLSPRRVWRTLALGGVAIGLTAAGIAVAPSALAATNPFERGPAPTAASIAATNGPFAISTTTVSRTTANGRFGGGTIYFPTDTSQGTFGAIVVTPGFTERQSAINWVAPRLASNGFVVFTIDTNSTNDQPSARSTQMRAALDYLVNTSSVRTRVDGSRLGVSGHSMGGGGSLEASVARPSLKAAMPMAPWDQTKNFSNDTVPTLIIGAQNDSIASISNHATRFYDSLPAAGPKMYVVLAGASHNTSNSPNATIQRFMIPWFKRFIDNDTRYSPFLCANASSTGTSRLSSAGCPF